MKLEKQKVCRKCDKAFTCYSADCWCNELPKIMPLDPLRNCYCSNCLKEDVVQKIQEYMNKLTAKKRTEIKSLGKVNNPLEGIDYYINEDKLFVFTAWYHLRKGSCCGNNCKHCPYKTAV